MSRKTLYKLARAGLIPVDPRRFRPRGLNIQERLERDGWVLTGVRCNDGREVCRVYCREEAVDVLRSMPVVAHGSFGTRYVQWGPMIRRHWLNLTVGDSAITDIGHYMQATNKTKIVSYYDDIHEGSD